MEEGFIDNFKLPEGAAEAIKNAGIKTNHLGDGVDYFALGHDKGVAFRFWVHQEKNAVKSKLLGVPISDSVDMIEWYVDKYQHPTEQLRFLPTELLEFDDEKKCIGGQYKESYDRWKNGLSAPGMPLTKWGELTDGQLFTLNEMKIFSVEQFAAMPRSKIQAKFPPDFLEVFEEAVRYVGGQSTRDAANKAADMVLSVSQENARLKDQMSAMQNQMESLLSSSAEVKPQKRKPGRPPVLKVIPETKEGRGE